MVNISNQFPVLVANPSLSYLDSAASTQKPKQVIDAVSKYYSNDYANIHRGVYELSHRSTELYDKAREKVQKFLGAEAAREIIFTRGATEALNLIAQSFGGMLLKAGDEVVLTEMEHHANIVPWQMVCERVGASIKVIPVDDTGNLKLETLDDLLSEKVKILSISQTSNALGTINPIKEITNRAKRLGIAVVVDGSQAVAHLKVDVQELNCDFYVFSGHKLYGPTGIGVLYGKKEHLELMPPYQGGGDMINTVSFEKTTYAEIPEKFEAGTPNMAGAVGLSAAIDFVNGIGLNEIREHELALLKQARDMVSAFKNIEIIGKSDNSVGIVSFVHSKAHAHDMGTILASCGVAVRAGHHCCQPLMDRYGLSATTRASFGVYTNENDIKNLEKGLLEVSKFFK